MKNFKKGFTLIELLVVIAIIGVLTAIIVPNFMGARERANDSKKKQDMETIKTALRMYYNDNQSYPADGEWKGALEGKIGNISSLEEYTYQSINNGDGFKLYTIMEATVAEDLRKSQLNCGVSPGGFETPDFPKRYYVCAF